MTPTYAHLLIEAGPARRPPPAAGAARRRGRVGDGVEPAARHRGHLRLQPLRPHRVHDQHPRRRHPRQRHPDRRAARSAAPAPTSWTPGCGRCPTACPASCTSPGIGLARGYLDRPGPDRRAVRRRPVRRARRAHVPHRRPGAPPPRRQPRLPRPHRRPGQDPRLPRRTGRDRGRARRGTPRSPRPPSSPRRPAPRHSSARRLRRARRLTGDDRDDAERDAGRRVAGDLLRRVRGDQHRRLHRGLRRLGLQLRRAAHPARRTCASGARPTVERIRALQPRRVLEIGVGTGLLLSQLAPDAEAYWATDFAAPVIRKLGEDLRRDPELAAKVELRCPARRRPSGLPAGLLRHDRHQLRHPVLPERRLPDRGDPGRHGPARARRRAVRRRRTQPAARPRPSTPRSSTRAGGRGRARWSGPSSAACAWRRNSSSTPTSSPPSVTASTCAPSAAGTTTS